MKYENTALLPIADILYKSFKDLYLSKGYDFDETPGNINLFGCRSGLATTNLFDDWLGVAMLEEATAQPVVYLWQATTDPGLSYFRKPINPHGVGSLAPGQYKKAYAIGTHFSYKALVQVKPVAMYRDSNKDLIFDWDPNTIEFGKFGVNIHKRNRTEEEVNGASAACQVFKVVKDFNEMMALAKAQLKRTKKNEFTYTLFTSEDVPSL